MKTTLWILSALLQVLLRPGEARVSEDRLWGEVCSPIERKHNIVKSRTSTKRMPTGSRSP